MDYAGAFKVASYLAILGGVLVFFYSIYRAGQNKQKVKGLEEDIEGHNEFHKEGEDWDRAGGLAGTTERVPKSKD